MNDKYKIIRSANGVRLCQDDVIIAWHARSNCTIFNGNFKDYAYVFQYKNLLYNSKTVFDIKNFTTSNEFRNGQLKLDLNIPLQTRNSSSKYVDV